MKWLKIIAVWMIILGGVVVGSVLYYLQNHEYEDAFKPINQQAHYATQMSKTTFALGRQFIITRKVELTVTREIFQKGAAEVRDLYPGEALPSYRMNFLITLREVKDQLPGRWENNRIITIPEIPPGFYRVRTVVCWDVNIIREKCVTHPELPELELEWR